MDGFHFTFKNIESQYQAALNANYSIITCEQFYHNKVADCVPPKTLVNRVDIDFSVKKAARIVDIFNHLNIKATFFLRLHAPEYNPFSFENYRIIKDLIESGHELGYHSEVIDQSVIWKEDAKNCLLRDIDVINKMFNIKIKGIASHDGMTGLNNLDFWQDKKASDFGLLYEAYDAGPFFNLFNDSFYISDSEWVRWKCYRKGEKVSNDHRGLEKHVLDGHPLLYVLIHSDTYFDNHFYE